MKVTMEKRQNMSELLPNEGKKEIIEVDGRKYGRYPIKTHVITDADHIPDVAERYAAEYLQEEMCLSYPKRQLPARRNELCR